MEALVHPHPAVAGLPVRSFALRALLARLGGSLLVSISTTLWSLSLLVLLTRTGLTAAGPANVVATLSGIPWSYWLNRRFVWRRRGAHRVRSEVLPFVTMCLVALAASTVSVTMTDRWAAAAGLASWWRTAAVVAANLGSFGLLWLAQFVLLDRLLFVDRAAPPAVQVNGPKVRGALATAVRTLQSGVGNGPTRDVDPSTRAGDEESERGS